MRNPPNYGSITKLKGTRRRPFMVRITTGRVVNFETKKAYNKQIVLGYYATRKEAAQALAEYNANPFNVDRQKVTIGEIWEQIKDRIDVTETRRESFKRAYNKYVNPALADKRIVETRTGALQDLINSIQYGYSTQVLVRCVLSQIYVYAAHNDIINQNYVEFVKVKPQQTKITREIYSAEEISYVWSKVEERPEYAFTLILLYEGMRIKELRDMEKDAVDLKEKTFEIRIAKNERSVRTIPIHSKVFPLVEQAMKTEGSKLFSFNKAHYDYFVKEHLKHRPYDTRHTFASKANEIGIPKLTIQRIMGHKPDSVLEISYIHLTMDEVREALEKVKY